MCTNKKNKNPSNLNVNMKFQNKVSKNPILLLKKLFENFRKRQAHKSIRFWLTNTLMLFVCLKAYQLTLFMNEFSYFIPKEELKKNNMKFNTRELSKLDQLELIQYLDRLDTNKIDRQSIKHGIEESINQPKIKSFSNKI